MSFQYDFDDSDLTELESDDEPGTPLLVQSQAAKAAAAKAKAAEMKKASKDINPPRLKECYHKTMSPDNLYRYLQEEVINLNPEYQRDVVWTNTNQGYLIDSLMHNYAVFPLIFAVRPREDGVEEMICIDGKQRITAIQQFMDCKIPYRDSQLNREMWYKTVPQAKTARNVISPAQRQRFNLMNIAVYEYKNITEHEEREIFQRVQNAVSLTAHERLRAYNGPNADLVRDMHRKTSDELRQFFYWDKAKGKDFFMLSQIAILINHHLSPRKGQYPATELKLNRVESFLHGKTAPTPKLRSATLGVIDTLNCLIRHPQWREPFTMIQPMWFVMSGFMIHLYRGKHSFAQLADIVRQMKEMVKAKTAAKAYKDLAAFVVDKVPNLKLKGDGKEDRPASSIAFDVQPVESQPVPSTSATVKVTPKRKRGASVSDAESEWDEEVEAPKKKATSARRKKPCLPESEDEDDDYQVVSTPPRTKTAAARTSIKKLAPPKGTGTGSAPVSKATTTVKRTTTKTGTSTTASKVPAKASASASAKEILLSSQVGKPSIKPSAMTKAKKPMTSCPATPLPAQVTPSASRSPMPPPLPSTSASAPLPTSRPGLANRPLHLSRPASPMSGSTGPFAFDRVKAEPRHSPAISTGTRTPPQSMSQTPFHSDRHPLPDRLAPLRAAKARVAADNAFQKPQQQPSPSMSTSRSGSSMSMSISSTSSGSGPAHWQHQHQQQQQHQPTSDPRRSLSSANPAPQPQPPPMTNDDDAELLAQLDVIESELTMTHAPALSPLTPAPSTSPTPPRVGTTSAVHPAQQRSQASASTDVVMADGTKEVLTNVQPIGRRPVAAHPPARPFNATLAPRPGRINTDVDEYRSALSASASGVSAARGQPGSMTTTSSVGAQLSSAPLPSSNGSFSVKGMPPIPRLPPQQPRTPMMPAPAGAAATPSGPASMREKDVGGHRSRGHQDSKRHWNRVYSEDSKDDDKHRRQRPEVPVDPRSRSRREAYY